MSTRRGTIKLDSKGERESWREKLQFLSDAMESTSQPFAAGGPDGSTMIFNEAFCRLTGYTRNELYHQSWATDLTTPESLPDELKMLEVLDRTHEPQRYEKYYRRKDGTVIPIELLTHVALDTRGNILFYYSFITDISDRKRKDEELSRARDRLERTVEERTAELSRSEERLRRMIEASPVPMVMFVGDTINFVNKKFSETFGYTIEDIPTLDHWWPLAYPDEEYRKFVVKRWDAATRPAIKDRASTEPREVLVTCKDGSKKQILSYFSSIGDLNLSVFYDITDRKKAEDALRESEEYLAADLTSIRYLQEVSTRFVEDDTLEALLEEIMETSVKVAGADMGTLQLLDPESGRLNIVAQRGFEQWYVDFFSDVSHGHAVCGTAQKRGERVIVEDVASSPIFHGTPALDTQRKAGVKSVQSTPLIDRNGRMTGMLSTHWRTNHQPDERVLGYLDLLARQAADIIERKRAEEKLAYVASFPELNPAPILEIDDDGKITYRNPAVDRLFPDLVARGSNHPVIKGIEPCPDSFSQAEGRQLVRDIEIDGVHYQQTILRMPESRTTRIYFTDITKRKRAEEALQDSEVRFRSLIQNSSDIIRILDRDGYIVYDSPSSEKILGYPPGYTLGKSPLEFIHPEDRAHIMKDLGLVYDARNSGIPSEFRTRKADGEYLDCESVGMNLIGIPGVDGIVVTTRPITERKRAEEERERLLRSIDGQRRQLQAIMDSIPAGVFISDASGKVLQVNEYGKKIWGGKVLLSESWQEYAEYKGYWPDTGKQLSAEEWATARALTAGETIIGEVVDIERFDGTRGTVLNCAAPVKDADGNITGGITINLDITERRKLEKDLNVARAQAELYLDLMGHDISNMHQIIMMQLELALAVMDEEGRLEAKDREMLTSSVKTLDRSINLISNVRMLQKVRSGEYRAEPLDLGPVIDEVVKIYSDIPGRDITIKYAPFGGRMVIASPLIKDVLGNLVDNAVKHSKDPVEIGISVGKVSYKGTGYYRVTVEDNGIGIPDEKKDLIFQRFKRGQSAAKGTGLGLYIVRTLVEGFGGQVKVEDRVPGDHAKGARFIVYLPVAEVKTDE
jgi:PAS domain S-box-containing protein